MSSEEVIYNVQEMAAELFELLRLRISPIGIKVLEKEEMLNDIPKCRRVNEKHTPCQLLRQSMSLGYTIALTRGDMPEGFSMCEGLHGLIPQDEKWHAGDTAVGRWYATAADGKAHLDTYPFIPYGKYEAIVSSPLASGRVKDPDVCMVIGRPGQIFFLLAGLLRHNYAPLDTPIIGESSCSQHWIRTLMTGKPNISLPCFAEMRFGEYPDDCVIFSATPSDLRKALDGTRELNRIGLRYPVPSFGVLHDPAASHSKGGKTN